MVGALAGDIAITGGVLTGLHAGGVAFRKLAATLLRDKSILATMAGRAPKPIAATLRKISRLPRKEATLALYVAMQDEAFADFMRTQGSKMAGVELAQSVQDNTR
jgi:hypothetical protein